jgi:hypothetical protein
MRLLLAAAVLAALWLQSDMALAARVSTASLALTYEQQTCGYECVMDDDLLGPDENLSWQADGSLAPGESFVYTYLPSKSGRYIYAQAYAYHGPGGPLQVTIETAFGTTTGLDKACQIFYWSGAITDWSVTVTNVGDRTAKRAYAWGQNYDDTGYNCP